MSEVKFFVENETASLLGRLSEFLAQRGIASYLVGGFVRDGLRGKVNRDLDIAVANKATEVAQEVSKVFKGRYVLLDAINGIARVVLPNPEKPWHLDFSTMSGTIEEDLSRRDFTINALALNLRELTGGWSKVEVLDPFRGIPDLEQGLVRAVGETVFTEDPARLLRAIRLAAEPGFAIEETTQGLVQRNHKLVTGVASERALEELGRILSTPRAYPSLRRLDELGLLTALIPELSTMKGVTQPKEHFWNVFDHSIETVGAAERLLEANGNDGKADEFRSSLPWSPAIAAHFEEGVGGGRTRKALLKFAALLHDIAKPQTKSVEPGGKVRFLGHSREGAGLAGDIMMRLRFSNREIRMVQRMIEQHLRPGQMSTEAPPTKRAIYRYFRDTDEVGIDTLFLYMADFWASQGPRLDLQKWRNCTQQIQYVLSTYLEEQDVVAPPKLIDGHDLIARFMMSPGPEIGELLEMAKEAQAAGEITTRDEALLFVERRLKRASA